MVDLGKYATEVLGAYAASLLLVMALVWLSLARARRIKRALKDIEDRNER